MWTPISSPMTHKETGVIEKTVLNKTYEEAHVEWRLTDFFPITQTTGDLICYYDSPSFLINDVWWRWRMYPRKPWKSEFVGLSVKTNVKQKYSFEFNFSLKKSDGSMQHSISGVLKENKIFSPTWDLLLWSELCERKSELAPQNVLTIVGTMRREITDSSQPTDSDKTTPMQLIRLDKLSEHFKDLFGDKESCDVTLNVKDKVYKVHMSVLITRSSVFAAAFKHDTLERQTGVMAISDCDPDSFALFLEYLYSGKLEDLSVCSALNLYYTSDKYDVLEVKTFCVEYLMHHLTVEDLCDVAVLADTYDDTSLFSAVKDFFIENASQIFLTSEWLRFMKKDNRLANKLLIEMSNVKLKGYAPFHS